MEKIYIVGASGFGKEVAWLIEDNNEYEIVGFIDDNEKLIGSKINGYFVVGKTDHLLSKEEKINVVIAIGKPATREIIVNKLKKNPNIQFPNIISKAATISKYVSLGQGNVICANSVVTTNISFGDFNHINLNTTVGHDVILNNYVTIYPSVNVSGNVIIGNHVEVGTGSQIIQGKSIIDDSIIGAGAVVVKNIEEPGTYVGIPVKKVK